MISQTTPQASTTVFAAIVESLQNAAVYNHDDAARPVAILWPDEKREWESLVPRLRAVLPQLLVFGPYDNATRSGPAIWLRCVLAGRIPEVTWDVGQVPILYLPGVSRPTLRATEECPTELRPLVELQYRSVFWSQYNGKDWTIAAFLQTDKGGLALNVAKDKATVAAIRRALEKLIDVPIAELRTKALQNPLDSSDFDSLVSDDPIDDLLTWLADPAGTKQRWDASRWETLCSRCTNEYGFDPVTDGELVGAERLGRQETGAWKSAWKRFAATPARYVGLANLLRKAKPQPASGKLFDVIRSESWPQDNEMGEAELRQALNSVNAFPVDQARGQLQELDKRHKPRREWVWAKLEQSPLAHAVEHLGKLAAVTATPLTGASTEDMIRSYVDQGWQADAAVLDCLATVFSHDDCTAVCTAIQHVYTPWLRDAAELFQQRLQVQPLASREEERLGEVITGTCVLFADGLRFDVGCKLKDMLQGRVGSLEFSYHSTALPSVTPTAKPAVSPVADKITGLTDGEEFRPSVSHLEKDLTIERFRKLLEDDEFQVLASTEIGDPKGRAWAEYGNLDQTGHQEGVGMARRIPELISGLVSRIESLLAAGWREVRVVTDHGWLLVPGSLPKADLPKFLTATRWGRCAIVKESASVDLTCLPWFWSHTVRVAYPNGIDCFIAGKEYNHGGLSLQECIVPRLVIRGTMEAVTLAKLEEVKWVGLRCRVKVTGQVTGCTVDLRGKANDAATSLLTNAKRVGTDGAAAFIVEDDAHEGRAGILVLLDTIGAVIDKMPVTVGE